jgi:DNA transposition AAA+ family ATPase
MEKIYNESLYNKFFELVGTYNEGKRFSLSNIGRSLGCSSRIVSQYKNRTYRGNIEIFEEKIDAWIKRETDRISRKEIVVSDLSTEALEKMRKVIDDAWDFKDIGLIIWDNAIGKTAALQQYIETNLPVFPVEVKPHFTSHTLMVELALSMSLYANTPTGDLIDLIVKSLQGQDTVIIIDDADYLSSASLELIRCIIVDRTEVGLVLMGSPRLEHRIRQAYHAYIFDRVGAFIKVDSFIKADKWIG